MLWPANGATWRRTVAANLPLGSDALVEIEAIKQLKARYCLLLDAQNWSGYRDLFTDDARISGDLPLTTPPAGSHYGPNEFVAAVRATLEGRRTLHTIHQSMIELIDVDVARGLWTYTQRGFGHTGGYYDEAYAKDDRGWRINTMTIALVHPYQADDPQASRSEFQSSSRDAVVERWTLSDPRLAPGHRDAALERLTPRPPRHARDHPI
jgi:SnoaL-like domain